MPSPIAPLLALALAAAPLLQVAVPPPAAHASAPAAQEKPVRRPVAVLVHPDNPVTNLTLAELTALLRLDRQFWEDKSHVVLIARPSDSAEQGVLLDRIYQMDGRALRKFWLAKLYAGKIPSIPTVVTTAGAAAKAVKRSVGAITVVLAADVPADAKVVTIDGRKPDDAAYPLFVAD